MQREKEVQQEALRKSLRELDEERENFHREIRKIQEREEREDEQLQTEFFRMERMREGCQPQDVKLLSLIDEKMDLLNAMKRRKSEFQSDLKEWVKKFNLKSEMEEQEIMDKLRVIEQEEERDV